MKKIIDPEECGGPSEVILGSNVGSLPINVDDCCVDGYGNPPGTIYFLPNPIKYIWSKFFGKKTEESTIEQSVENFIKVEFPEPVLDCSDLEKTIFYTLCEMFEIQPKYLKKKFHDHYNATITPRYRVIGKFKFTQGSGFAAYIFDSTEPELCERILGIRLYKDTFKIDYTYGVWDKQFMKTITEFSEKKRIKAEKAKKIKEERIQKMFVEEGEE